MECTEIFFYFLTYLRSEWYGRAKTLMLEKNDLVERYDF